MCDWVLIVYYLGGDVPLDLCKDLLGGRVIRSDSAKIFENLKSDKKD